MKRNALLRTLAVLLVLCLAMTSVAFAGADDICIEVSWPEGAETSPLTIALYLNPDDAEPMAVLVLDGAADDEGEAEPWKGLLTNADPALAEDPIIRIEGDIDGYGCSYEDGVASVLVEPVSADDPLEEPELLEGKAVDEAETAEEADSGIQVTVAWDGIDAEARIPVTVGLFENEAEEASVLIPLDGSEETPWTAVFTDEVENPSCKLVDLPAGYSVTENDNEFTISAAQLSETGEEVKTAVSDLYEENTDDQPTGEGSTEGGDTGTGEGDSGTGEGSTEGGDTETGEGDSGTTDSGGDSGTGEGDSGTGEGDSGTGSGGDSGTGEGDSGTGEGDSGTGDEPTGGDTDGEDTEGDNTGDDTGAYNTIDIFRLDNGIDGGKARCGKSCMLPATGINGTAAPQPLSVNYRNLGLSIELPSIGISAEIMNVPFVDDAYAVTWLGGNAGLLEGSAMPGEGRTWIAAHNHINADEYGPFANIGSLSTGDRVFIADHTDGSMTVYEVYANMKVAADDAASVYAAADEYDGSLTLITCEDEDVDGGYINRRVICAKPL